MHIQKCTYTRIQIYMCAYRYGAECAFVCVYVCVVGFESDYLSRHNFYKATSYF